jgi:hypothetical protein
MRSWYVLDGGQNSPYQIFWARQIFGLLDSCHFFDMPMSFSALLFIFCSMLANSWQPKAQPKFLP